MSRERKDEIKSDIQNELGQDEEEFSISQVKKYLRKYEKLINYFEEKGKSCILVKLFEKYEGVELNLLVNWVYSVNHVIKCKELMMQFFPDFSILEKINLFVRIKLSSEYKLSQIFGKLNENQEMLNIDEYNVKQMSLEQIFLTFADENKD
jgi:hypothetical protein